MAIKPLDLQAVSPDRALWAQWGAHRFRHNQALADVVLQETTVPLDPALLERLRKILQNSECHTPNGTLSYHLLSARLGVSVNQCRWAVVYELAQQKLQAKQGPLST